MLQSQSCQLHSVADAHCSCRPVQAVSSTGMPSSSGDGHKPWAAVQGSSGALTNGPLGAPGPQSGAVTAATSAGPGTPKQWTAPLVRQQSVMHHHGAPQNHHCPPPNNYCPPLNNDSPLPVHLTTLHHIPAASVETLCSGMVPTAAVIRNYDCLAATKLLGVQSYTPLPTAAAIQPLSQFRQAQPLPLSPADHRGAAAAVQALRERNAMLRCVLEERDRQMDELTDVLEEQDWRVDRLTDLVRTLAGYIGQLREGTAHISAAAPSAQPKHCADLHGRSSGRPGRTKNSARYHAGGPGHHAVCSGPGVGRPLQLFARNSSAMQVTTAIAEDCESVASGGD